MSIKDPAIYISEALSKKDGLPATDPSHRNVPPFTIAFSREFGAGGTPVGREVGRRLNWPVYDHELLEQIARDLKVEVSRLEDVDERPGSFLVESIKSFADIATVTEVTYFRRLLRMLLALGDRGECVIVGRGAPLILKPESTLRVRMVALRQDRIAAIARERGYDEAKAARFVDDRDRERVKFLKDHFKKDANDPLNYDLVLNTSRFSVDEAAELVIEALQRYQARRRLQSG